MAGKSFISPPILSRGAIAQNTITTGLKMEFSLEDATSVIKEFDGTRPESAQDWVDETSFYSDQLSQEGKEKLAKYIYHVALKRRAKEAFRGQVPSSVEEICDFILKRFKPIETLMSMQRLVAGCYQGNRTGNNSTRIPEIIQRDMVDLQFANSRFSGNSHNGFVNRGYNGGRYNRGCRIKIRGRGVCRAFDYRGGNV